jgi:hypothetical protein
MIEDLKHTKSGEQVLMTRKRANKEPLITEQEVTLVAGRFIEAAGKKFLKSDGSCVSGSVNSAAAYSISSIVSEEQQNERHALLKERFIRALAALSNEDAGVTEYIVEKLESLVAA